MYFLKTKTNYLLLLILYICNNHSHTKGLTLHTARVRMIKNRVSLVFVL